MPQGDARATGRSAGIGSTKATHALSIAAASGIVTLCHTTTAAHASTASAGTAAEIGNHDGEVATASADAASRARRGAVIVACGGVVIAAFGAALGSTFIAAAFGTTGGIVIAAFGSTFIAAACGVVILADLRQERPSDDRQK